MTKFNFAAAMLVAFASAQDAAAPAQVPDISLDAEGIKSQLAQVREQLGLESDKLSQ